MKVLRGLWKLLVGVKDALVLLLLLLFFGTLYAGLTARPNPKLASSGAWLVKLDGAVVEQPEDADPLAIVSGNGPTTREYKLRDVIRAIRFAATDPAVKVVVLDLDNFKYINDRFGHAFGDVILKDFAITLQRLVRRTDIFGRVGGEEFVLILPNTTPDEAEVIVHRMLLAVRQSRPLPEHAGFRYTFSAGIACAVGGDDVGELYRRADLALYAAKMKGRDQISIEPDTHPARAARPS